MSGGRLLVIWFCLLLIAWTIAAYMSVYRGEGSINYNQGVSGVDMIDTVGYIACDPGKGERLDQHSDRPVRETWEAAKLDANGDHWAVKVVGSDGMLYESEPEEAYWWMR